MLQFTIDEMKAYVQSKLLSATIIEAKKIGNTIAFQGRVGQEVISYEVDSDGNEYVERTGVVSLDPETNEPDWVLTKTGLGNQPIVNEFGHLNQYIVTDSSFRLKYEPSNEGLGLYSKKQIEKFIQCDEDISFETKNGEMVVTEGGYIKVTDLDKISAISEQSFNDTYLVLDQSVKARTL
jgi:hypothetical protein